MNDFIPHSVAPDVSQFLESMRDIGYTIETALADIVDNSISAGANKIDIFVDDSEFKIGILDNGSGMSQKELLQAMTPGCRHPQDVRSETDLGRFGLGLKTASFSQCRKLTVLTKKKQTSNAAIWDLDFVEKKKDWCVKEPLNLKAIQWFEKLKKQGTLVLWEQIDRAIQNVPPQNRQRQFNRKLDKAIKHLELVFHRYLSGERGLKKITITVNGNSLEPFDPFHTNHPATIHGPVEELRIHDATVKFQTFTLPHHRKLSPDQWDRNGGEKGYLRGQGFYVYRQRRLIVFGTWFGMVKQSELLKLARVKVDIPNSLDSEWKIDVKKASAEPPYQITERLKKIVEKLGSVSKRVYVGRGERLASDKFQSIWTKNRIHGQLTYVVNEDHPAVKAFFGKLGPSERRSFKSLVKVIQSTLPLDSLFADLGSQPKAIDQGLDIASLEEAVTLLVEGALQDGTSKTDIMTLLQTCEPYRSNWEAVEAVFNRLIVGR